MSCNIAIERDVNEVLWNSIFNDKMPFGINANDFENSTFEVKSYKWDGENDYNFYHKPSGLKIAWYKYPLRDPMSNMEITHEQFLTVLRDCFNSINASPESTVKVSYSIDPWW